MLGLSRYFWISSVLFVFNQLAEKQGYYIPFVHSYLDDLLCPGIVLGFVLFIQQQFTYRSRYYRLPKLQIVFFVAWYSLLFEFLFPLCDTRHYADPWDILAYGAGAFLFYIFGNREVAHLWLRSATVQEIN
ncbi:MAG: hypothetical protein ACPF9D_01580 [Owenweeksia sp.]